MSITRRGLLGVGLVFISGAGVWAEQLPPGFVQGDVVSYSYVPNKTFTPQESIGILPYLMEYNLMLWTGNHDKDPEFYHDENIRRIDIASQWSTAIELYNRYIYFHDEIINLMIRCFNKRQLIILSARPNTDPEKNAHQNLIEILEMLWNGRDNIWTSPEGDTATGRQLINNILAANLGDEGECGLKTAGLQQLFDRFDNEIRLREMDGEQPFKHIKGWYNMLAYHVGCHAACQTDVDQHNRFILPSNTQCIGVDVYHYWFVNSSPYDPADLSIPRSSIRAHSDEWQRLRTRYYPEGLDIHDCGDPSARENWIPECWNDSHALMNNIALAGATNAMMWYIALSSQLVNAGSVTTFTTPIETMESYYDHLKAGPWAAVSWWYFAADRPGGQGGLDYYDKTLVHCTAQHPEGIPYSQEMLDYWHNEYVALKKRMFNDVVYNQFAYLNPLAPKQVAVGEDAKKAIVGVEYGLSLEIVEGSMPMTWSLLQGPAGMQLDADGRLHGWIPEPDPDYKPYTVTVTVRLANDVDVDDQTWNIVVDPLPADTIAFFPFNANRENWMLGGWRSGPFVDGTAAWSSTDGHPGGHLYSIGSGATNSTDSCTREGTTLTRRISTAGLDSNDIYVEYDVIAQLNTPPASGCSTNCIANVLEGSCADKLVVYYSRTGTAGPWTAVQVLTEGVNLPTTWTRQTVDLSTVPAAAGNPDFALQFKWQFNTQSDVGRIDNIRVASKPAQPPSLVGAVSRKRHGLAGNMDIALPLDGTPGLEPRQGGPTTVVLTFNKDIAAADGLLNCSEVTLSSGACRSVSAEGSDMILDLIGMPEHGCLTITVQGVTDLAGRPLIGDNDVQVCVREGKVNGTGAVDAADLDKIKQLLYQPATGANFTADVVPDGVINIRDLSLVKKNQTRSATCP